MDSAAVRVGVTQFQMESLLHASELKPDLVDACANIRTERAFGKVYRIAPSGQPV